jgi:hypothetical protein
MSVVTVYRPSAGEGIFCFYGARRLVTVIALDLVLSHLSPVHIRTHYLSRIHIWGLFLVSFLLKISYEYLVTSIRATFLAGHVIPCLIITLILAEK